jgi:sugar lactone lactonase YvrE
MFLLQKFRQCASSLIVGRARLSGLLLVAVLTFRMTAAIAADEASWPELPEKNASVTLPAQEWPQKPGPRTITASIHYPDGTLASVDRSTGLMLTLHNWGGTDCAGTANPDALAKRLNVVAICVNYLQSGKQASIDDPEPYDCGYLQGLDALRALWFVIDGLQQRELKFDLRRIFATGGSGGGNVTQMVNKLAPRTFTCVIDMCGMAKLSDDIAFNLPGGTGLNARWSRDPDSPNWLSPADQEIRFVAKPEHLSVLTRLKNAAKIVVVHGVDDSTCPFADKQELVANMQAAGLDVEPHFVTKDDLDGEVFTSSGHALGNRTEIVFRVAGKYLTPGTKTTLLRRQKTDFERRDSSVGFPVTGGEFVISYEAGYPVGRLVSDEWPPPLAGAKNGTVTVRSDALLQIPDDVQTWSGEDGAAPFIVAKTPPTVDLALQQDLGEGAIRRRLWSSWGDICLASDGRVYCGIGDHGNDAGGDARCFVYRWDPQSKSLEQIVDMNQVVPPREGQPAWSKIHAKIDEGPEGKIYFCCTLNAGNRAGDEQYHWTPELPGGQVYQFDPATGKTRVFASLPPKRCTATSLFDRTRNIWWCNLEAGEGDALWGLDLTTGKPVTQTPDGTVAFNRAFALANDGSILFNGAESLWRLTPGTFELQQLKATFGDVPGMRCATRESSTGMVYGATHKTNELFRYDVKNDELKLLGPNWLTGQYTTVMEVSPDERFLYYLPGAHGRAWEHGTPVVQYEIATGQRKVIAFLAETFEQQQRYVPGGTYGIKLSEDGGTLFVNFNGHAAEELRTSAMRPIGFGLCSFAAIHIPASER